MVNVGEAQPFCQDGTLHVMWQIQISQAQPLPYVWAAVFIMHCERDRGIG